MSVLHVACVVEGDYVPHCAAMLHSVLSHRGGLDVQVHYLHEPGSPSESEQLLAEMVESMGGRVSFLSVPDEQLAGLPTKGFTGKATWYRIFLPELLPELDRVLFLDADLIVLTSLEPLWQTDLTGHYVAAVTNVFQPDHLHRHEELGLQRPQDYFNAGVLLMNLDLMRRDGCTAALKEYGIAHAGELLFRDQDVLNAVLSARRLPLEPRWNCMNAFTGYDWTPYIYGLQPVRDAWRNPAIRHFEGPGANKPWHLLCDAVMRDVYFQHRRQTPWPKVRLDAVTPLNVWRKVLMSLGWRIRHRRLRGGDPPDA